MSKAKKKKVKKTLGGTGSGPNRRFVLKMGAAA